MMDRQTVCAAAAEEAAQAWGQLQKWLDSSWNSLWQAFVGFGGHDLPVEETCRRKITKWLWAICHTSEHAEDRTSTLLAGAFWKATTEGYRKKLEEINFAKKFAETLERLDQLELPTLAETLERGKSVYKHRFMTTEVYQSIYDARRTARSLLDLKGGDYYNDCFDRMWHALPKYDSAKAKFHTYAVTVCKNLIKDLLDQNKKQAVPFSSMSDFDPPSEAVLFSPGEPLSEADFIYLREIDLLDRIRLVVYHALGSRIPEAYHEEWKAWCRDSLMDESQIAETFGPVKHPAKFLAEVWGLDATVERQSSWRRAHSIVYLPWFWKSLQRVCFEPTQVGLLLALEPVEDRLVCSCLTPNWHKLHDETQVKKLHEGRRISKNFPWLSFTEANRNFPARSTLLSKEIKERPEEILQRWDKLEGLRQRLLEEQP